MTPRHASRLMVRTLQLCALSTLLSFSLTSEAAIKVTSVSGASRTENVGSTETESPVIFGGVTGVAATACSGTGLCNTCTTTPINSGGLPCNLTAIYSGTRLTISFTSAKAGFPILTNDDKDAEIGSGGTSSVAAGNVATVSVLWSDICSTYSSDFGSDCIVTAGTAATVTLNIGVTKADDGKLTEADDEYTAIKITISNFMEGNQYAPDDCSTTTSAACGFAVQSGDEKAVLTDLSKTGGFPNLGGIGVYAMRVFAEECPWSAAPPSAADFNTISPKSISVDVRVDSSEDGKAEVDDAELTGLQNKNTYCVKFGHVDDAMNVGMFTPPDAGMNTGDLFCESIYLHDASGAEIPRTCHIARPDEVMGILSQNCFIATAAYGSKWSLKVQTFRDFRNHFLLTNKFGRKFVKWYYKHSPKYAKKIAKSETARAITRGALTPIWLFARISLKIGLLATTLLAALLFASPFIWLAYRRKKLQARL